MLGFIERPATVWGPSWTLPVGGVSASVSTRFGGLSQGAFASLNLGFFTGDEPARVRRNRERFAATAGFDPRRAIFRRAARHRVIDALKIVLGEELRETRMRSVVLGDYD